MPLGTFVVYGSVYSLMAHRCTFFPTSSDYALKMVSFIL